MLIDYYSAADNDHVFYELFLYNKFIISLFLFFYYYYFSLHVNANVLFFNLPYLFIFTSLS